MPQLTVEAGTHSWARSAPGGGAKIRRSGRLNSSVAMRSLRSSGGDGLHIHLPIFPSHLPQRNPGKYAYSFPIVPNRGRSRFGPCASFSRRPQELRPEVFPAIERHDCKSCPSRFTSRSAGPLSWGLARIMRHFQENRTSLKRKRCWQRQVSRVTPRRVLSRLCRLFWPCG